MSARGEASVGVRALGFLTRCTQRSDAAFRGVSSGEVSVGFQRWGFLTRCTQRLGALFRGVWRYIYS